MPLPYNWPASIDALSTPSPTTNRDAAGYSLADSISRIHRLLEALEARFGTGAANGTPTAGRIYGATGTGTAGYRQVVNGDVDNAAGISYGKLNLGNSIVNADVANGAAIAYAKLALAGSIASTDLAAGATVKRQLNYVASSDQQGGGSATANTWHDLGAIVGFSLDAADSLVLVSVRGTCSIGGIAATHHCASRVIVDNATSVRLGGSFVWGGTTAYANALGGGSVVGFVGLAAGSHNIKAQVLDTVTGALMYCRPASAPGFEHLNIEVYEIKRAASV